MDRSASCGSRAFYLDWRPASASALKKKGCSTANQEAVPNPTEHSLETIYDAAANDIFGFWSHQSASPPQRKGQRHRAPIIYLVDDDPSFLRALSRRLRALDYQVETFGSAEQFLRPPPLQTPRLAWCSICRFRGPADWDCRRRSRRRKNRCRWSLSRPTATFPPRCAR